MAAINSDPEVTRYLGGRGGPETAAPFLVAAAEHWSTYGYGYWGIERRTEPGTLLGFVGLGRPTLAAALDRVELGWRLARDAWGQGLTTEAATAVATLAWERLEFPELISLIHPENRRSQRVAEKLGMTMTEHTFHPEVKLTVEVWRLPAPGGAGVVPLTTHIRT